MIRQHLSHTMDRKIIRDINILPVRIALRLLLIKMLELLKASLGHGETSVVDDAGLVLLGLLDLLLGLGVLVVLGPHDGDEIGEILFYLPKLGFEVSRGKALLRMVSGLELT